MKTIHLPTLFMNILLLVLARYTIEDYPDFFLIFCTLPLLALHLIWAFFSRKSFLLSQFIGLCLYVICDNCGWVASEYGFFGLDGGLAWFYYGVFLSASLTIILILSIVRRLRKL